MSIRPFLAALVLLAALTGCTENTQQEVSDTATTVASEVRDSAESAAESVGEAAESAGEAIRETGVAAEVKTALMASDQVETSHLNVDVDGETVFLRGTVPAEEQVALAEQIAIETVSEGTAVTNELTVAADEDHHDDADHDADHDHDHDDPDHTH